MKGFKTLIGILNNSNVSPPVLCIYFFQRIQGNNICTATQVTRPRYILINSNAITYADNILEWSNIILAKINQKYSKSFSGMTDRLLATNSLHALGVFQREQKVQARAAPCWVTSAPKSGPNMCNSVTWRQCRKLYRSHNKTNS